MAGEGGKLGKFFKEASNWYWDEFVRAETGGQYNSNESIVFAVIRACAMEDINAIRIGINRLDGKLVTPIKKEYPKVYHLFPYAKQIASTEQKIYSDNLLTEPDSTPDTEQKSSSVSVDSTVSTMATFDEDGKREYAEPETPIEEMTQRETIQALGELPRELPNEIIRLENAAEHYARGKAARPAEIPRVKSVIAAHLISMSQRRNIDALFEVFDQIDGKLVETIKLIGEDMYITSYATEAPEGAYLNEDGILQLEAEDISKLWAKGLDSKK